MSGPVVSVFRRVDRPRGAREDVALETVIGRIRSGAVAEAVAAVRAEPDGERRKALKERLPAFTPSGCFERREASGLVAHAGTVVYDFDHVADVGALRARVLECPHLVAGFVSPSGDGYKAVLRVLVVDPATGEMRPPGDAAEHRLAWEAGARLLDAGGGGELDASGKDVARACFLSHDPVAHFDGGAEALLVELAPKPPPRRPEGSARGAPAGDRERARLESALSHIGRAGRLAYPEWVKLIAAVLDAVGGDAREAEGLLVQYVGEEVPGEYAAKLAAPTDREVTAASLFWLAREAGWSDPFARPDDGRPTDRQRRAAGTRQEAGQRPEAGEVAPLGVRLSERGGGADPVGVAELAGAGQAARAGRRPRRGQVHDRGSAGGVGDGGRGVARWLASAPGGAGRGGLPDDRGRCGDDDPPAHGSRRRGRGAGDGGGDRARRERLRAGADVPR